MKVLILAEVCNPDWASLPFFSYSLAKSISNYVDVVLVTHIRNKDAIDKIGCGNAEVFYIDNEYIASPIYRLTIFLQRLKLGNWMMKMALNYPSYLAFEYEVWRKFKSQLNQGDFDLIHRISPVSPTLPSPLAKWAKIPFILGPINGGLSWPKLFSDELKKEKEYLINFRSVFKYLPYTQATFKKSKLILAAFKHVEVDIPLNCMHKVQRFNELGIDPDFFKPKNKINTTRSCRFLFVGRLVPYKNPDVVLKAFLSDAELYENHQLTIVGDGSEMPHLQQIIANTNAEVSHIELCGWKSAEEISSYMQESDIFVFPTIREVGGNVILEAMASGLPCIVPDYGGPAELVNHETGIKLPLTNKADLIESVKSAMLKLANDHELRKKMSANSVEFSKNYFSWNVKAKQLQNLYLETISLNL